MGPTMIVNLVGVLCKVGFLSYKSIIEHECWLIHTYGLCKLYNKSIKLKQLQQSTRLAYKVTQRYDKNIVMSPAFLERVRQWGNAWDVPRLMHLSISRIPRLNAHDLTHMSLNGTRPHLLSASFSNRHLFVTLHVQLYCRNMFIISRSI